MSLLAKVMTDQQLDIASNGRPLERGTMPDNRRRIMDKCWMDGLFTFNSPQNAI